MLDSRLTQFGRATTSYGSASQAKSQVLSGRNRVLLGVSGSIAAFKAVSIASELVKRNFEVRAALTEGAVRFVAPLTFEAITGHPAPSSVWDEQPGSSRMGHIELGAWAEVIAIAPAGAGIIARLALGLPDDMLGAAALVSRAPMLIAPAMETAMWQHPATQQHIATLVSRGAIVLPPETGRLASGAVGEGRMAEPLTVVAAIEKILVSSESLAGVRVLVSAGPTYEAIDPVRFVGNRSSGKTGYAIAEVARDRGAAVTLVSGPTHLTDPPGVETIHIESTAQLREAMMSRAGNASVIVMATAVADFRPEAVSDHKIHRSERLSLTLAPTSDIAAELVVAAPHALHVGFALEDSNPVESARSKLRRKGQQLVVANSLSPEFSPFGSESNRVWFVTEQKEIELPELSKRGIAARLWDEIEALLAQRLKQ
jgi:phosphopantothenoylcysteine decarboxylase / phosphopantothenate---cysteine ligase